MVRKYDRWQYPMWGRADSYGTVSVQSFRVFLWLGKATSIKIDYSGPLSLGRDCTSRSNICCDFCFERHVTVNTQLLQTLYHINQPKYKMWNEVSETFIICSAFTFGFVFRFIFRLSVVTFSKLGFDRHEGLASTFSRWQATNNRCLPSGSPGVSIRSIKFYGYMDMPWFHWTPNFSCRSAPHL